MPDRDFWLLDSPTLAVLHFTEAGELLGAEIITDSAIVVEHARWLGRCVPPRPAIPGVRPGASTALRTVPFVRTKSARPTSCAVGASRTTCKFPQVDRASGRLG
ncbi:DUF6879 family protein [Streptomyces kaniharaensis]|uniref:DUF6879 family protein n=1 Tax=Streptomyces kaniharaensis TaxID=212423 RepID=UPI003899D6F8